MYIFDFLNNLKYFPHSLFLLSFIHFIISSFLFSVSLQDAVFFSCGDSLSSKGMTYLTNSLFDYRSPENNGVRAEFILDAANHKVTINWSSIRPIPNTPTLDMYFICSQTYLFWEKSDGRPEYSVFQVDLILN